MNLARILSSALVAGILLTIGWPAITVQADTPPIIPHAFYGNVTLDGSPAPVGTEVEARVNGAFVDLLTTTAAGLYGGSGLEPKLIVQGDFLSNTMISFWVNGITAMQTAPFQPGAVTVLNLTATVSYDNIAVVFPDPNLETVIRQAIAKSEGNIYRAHLERITTLNADSKGISNLSGLQYCTNLNWASFGSNQISDLTTFSGLNNMSFLQLGGNQISNLSPLPSLTHLSSLGLGHNHIRDISPLAPLVNLVTLYVNDNPLDSGIGNILECTPLELEKDISYSQATGKEGAA